MEKLVFFGTEDDGGAYCLAPGAAGADRGELRIEAASPTGILVRTTIRLSEGTCLSGTTPQGDPLHLVVVWSAADLALCRPESLLADRASPALPQRLASYRRRKGMSLAALAGHLGVTKQALWYWETGRRTPRPALREQMERLLAD